MSTQNPYQPPSAAVVDQSTGGELGEPQKRPVSDGWRWIADGFGLFKAGIGVWIGMIIVYFVLMIVLSIIPLVNFLLMIIAPVFTAGFMVAARNSDLSGGPSFGDMFAGFRERTGDLVLLGLIYFGFSILVTLIMFAVFFIIGGSQMAMTMSGMEGNPDPAQMQAFGLSMILGFLVAMLLFIPLLMAIWFAPALVILSGMSPWAAFKLSFKGCLRNVLPFLWYGVIALILMIIASIPLGLGLLVFMPTLIASVYSGYKTIFLQP